MSEIVERLRSIANAYPEDIFGPVTAAEVKEHAGLITRNSAAIGRHLGKFMLEAADEIERLERALAAERKLAPSGILYPEIHDAHRGQQSPYQGHSTGGAPKSEGTR